MKHLVFASVLCLGMSSNLAMAAVSSETEAASRALGASMVSEVTFEPGQSALTETSKKEIREFISSARASGAIDEVKLAVWADREYPVDRTKASKADVKLANDRAKTVKDFLKKEMDLSSVNAYNMTERPNALQKFLKTPTAQVKGEMETAGAAPRTTDETGWFNTKAQASKAILMIYTK